MPSPSHCRTGKRAQLLGCVLVVTWGMQAHGAGPGVPPTRRLSMYVEPDLAGPYSHLRDDRQSWSGPMPEIVAPQDPHPARPLPA